MKPNAEEGLSAVGIAFHRVPASNVPKGLPESVLPYWDAVERVPYRGRGALYAEAASLISSAKGNSDILISGLRSTK